MKRVQINLLNVGIILVIVGLAIGIYYIYIYNLKTSQQNIEFQNFVQNIQNLENTITTFQGNYFIRLSVPNDVIIYYANNSIVLNYNNNNYSITFNNYNISLYNNNSEINYLLYPNEIYFIKSNNHIYITNNYNESEYLIDNNTYNMIINSNNSNNIISSNDCLYNYTGQTSWNWGDVNGDSYLPPIGNQGTCGDCWAWSAAYAIASNYMIYNNLPNLSLYLSPTEIAVNCNVGNPNSPGYCQDVMGCLGGLPYQGIQFSEEYGIGTDNNYNTYYQELADCSTNISNYPGDVCGQSYSIPNNNIYVPDSEQYLASGFLDSEEAIGPGGQLAALPPSGDLSTQQIKQDLLCYGPLSISGFLGGLSNQDTSYYLEATGHATLLVGFNDNSNICQEEYNQPGCWIIQNEWGQQSACIIVVYNTTNYYDTTPLLIPNNMISIQSCSQLFLNQNFCNYYVQKVLGSGYNCGGVYWMNNGYIYVPYNSTPYGQSLPYYIISINNVTYIS